MFVEKLWLVAFQSSIRFSQRGDLGIRNLKNFNLRFKHICIYVKKKGPVFWVSQVLKLSKSALRKRTAPP